ncbi:hypothetical protein CS063_17185 [Sporanaerobium hydrogeniformans]|uniref:Uncharacterized protein n=2 Tax=Sporanaerobium hydrogeniformans TaxID=3072179 RepID=A0AC61D658_9FIRM|nr:hypothetical protein CS063_17185 [Sporanaerobium hydrogeniformans]
MEKREVRKVESQGLQVKELLLIGVLLAAGAVLKIFSNTIIAGLPLKPNFIIAMYCLAILLIKPKLIEALVIGLLSGIMCQFLPGNTPYANIVSEVVGAFIMFSLMQMPFGLKLGKASVKPFIVTFLSTLASGYTFFLMLKILLLMGMDINTKAIMAFTIIIFGTAFVNSILVTVLYPALKAVTGDKNA